MSSKPLTSIIQELVEADRVRLPVHPVVARQVAACLKQSEDGSEQLWEFARRDPALLCYLFRAANSSFYAGLQRTLSLGEAITRLGGAKAVEAIRQACTESGECTTDSLMSRYMPALWLHAQGCAIGARWLAQRCGYEDLSEQAYLAGMLHDVGKQFLVAVLDEIVRAGEFGMALSDQLLSEVLTTMHVEQGKRLFDNWNLPEAYRDVVAEHHEENPESPDVVAALVKLANKGCKKIGLGLHREADIVLPTTAEAQFLGIGEIALAEFEIMLEDHFFEGQPQANASGSDKQQPALPHE
jgi:HD-like signal output (HDOD) protein